MLVDPDGREIVDPSGNICYTKQDGWLPNAPEETKRVGNAMMETETGREQFDKLVDSETKIQIKISQEDKGETMGQYDASNQTNGDGNVTEDAQGNIIVKKAVITIFEGSIQKFLDGSAEVNINNMEGIIGNITRLVNPSINEYIGATAGHESEHNTKENLKLQASGLDSEHGPNFVKLKILMELYK
jgi:hypothetical protein